MKQYIFNSMAGILIFCIPLFFGCSSQPTTPVAPEKQVNEVLPLELTKSTTAYSEYEFVGGSGDPQPLSGKSIISSSYNFVGDPTGPHPSAEILQGGDYATDFMDGTPDDWTAFNSTIEVSVSGSPRLYSEAGNRSYPTTCQQMTLSSFLKWRARGQGKWRLYAKKENWTVYNKYGQIVSGTFGWYDSWESKNNSTHIFYDTTNNPPNWTTNLETSYLTQNIDKAVLKE